MTPEASRLDFSLDSLWSKPHSKIKRQACSFMMLNYTNAVPAVNKTKRFSLYWSRPRRVFCQWKNEFRDVARVSASVCFCVSARQAWWSFRNARSFGCGCAIGRREEQKIHRWNEFYLINGNNENSKRIPKISIKALITQQNIAKHVQRPPPVLPPR